ncbi:MAG: hypothetical protein Q4A00_01855 [Flavobacteriaceae bacterium]|nr:hypothetical protein [Flavobacteriaceae bacterium]
MNLASYIYSFLHEQKNTVVVSDFGIFSIEKTHAKVDEQAAKILPPRESLSFKRVEKISDTELADFIAKKIGKNLSEVQNDIDNRVKHWLQILNIHQKLNLDGLGEISIENNEWAFTPSIHSQSIDYFGLEEINLKEIGNPRKGYNKAFFWAFIIALIFGGVSLAFYYRDWISENITSDYLCPIIEEIERTFNSLF